MNAKYESILKRASAPYPKRGHTIDDEGKVSKALALAVPAGCVRDENGVDRKVLGKMPDVSDKHGKVVWYAVADESALSSTEKGPA